MAVAANGDQMPDIPMPRNAAGISSFHSAVSGPISDDSHTRAAAETVNPDRATHFGFTRSVSRPMIGAMINVAIAIGASISADWVGCIPRAIW